MLKKMSFISILAGVFLLAISVSPVFAAAPLPVNIVVHELYGDDTLEPFSASGPAVDAGLLCGSGMVKDTGSSVNDSAGPYRIIRASKQFVCGGESFDLEMVVRLDLTTFNTTARWRIIGGTGDFSGLKGHGLLIGTSNNPDPNILDIVDVYDGVLH